MANTTEEPRKPPMLSPEDVAKIRLLTEDEITEALRRGRENRLAVERTAAYDCGPDSTRRYR